MNKDEQNVKGIVLKQIEYKDNDIIISLLSEQGKLLSFYARGVKKITSKNANAVQAFVYSEIEYFYNQKGLHTLKRAKAIKNYFNDFDDYSKIIVAFMLLDIINDVGGLSLNDNPRLFKLLKSSLILINDVDENLLLSFFMIDIMQQQGITLVVDHCAICENDKVNYISIESGGFICHSCLDNNESNYDIEILKLFRVINKIELDDLKRLDFTRNNYKVMLKIIYSFYNNYTGLIVKNFEKLTLA